ncbi:MAG: polysaccharide deacetylase family protein [Bacteroidota bacterium]
MIFKTPLVVKRIYPRLTWEVPVNKKKLFLTFDDGPIPGITHWVLDLLSKYNAKATFFCIGRNVERNQKLFEDILNEKHSVGNHSYSHVRGLFKNEKQFLEDIELANEYINSPLFRPPHGRISRKEINVLSKKYKIIMWDVLSNDFNPKISAHRCYKKVVKCSKPGSIILFHDSCKAEKNMKISLENSLKYFQDEGYMFESLPVANLTP